MRTNAEVFRSFLKEAAKNNERSQYWKAIVQSLHDGIVSLDGANNVVEWNDGARKIFGHSRKEAVGKDIDRLVGGARIKEALGITRAVLRRKNQVIQAESVRYRKDGTPVDVSITASPILMKGKIEGGVAIYKDISERKKREKEIENVQRELQSLKEFNENIVNSLAEGIVMEDARGRVVFVNPLMESLLGFTASELVGHHQRIFISPEELARLQGKTRSRTKKTLETYETRFRSKSGEEIPVLVSARSLFEKSRFTGVLSAVTDISEQKRVEEALRASQLESQVANAAKSEFLANMSHEIRTPMNGIIGMTELALDTPLSPEQRDYLESIKASADSLLAIINDILDFSKIEARMIDFEPVRFGLRDSVEETAASLALGAHQKGLELVCRVQPDVPDSLVGDVRRLRQIIINLAGNSIKFTRRGEVLIETALESRTRNDAVLRFTVSDTGIGIPPEKQGAIFQPFVQADGSMTRKYGGTGLGLAISAQLVEMMGGRIRVESEPGRGSRFSFTARFGTQKRAARKAVSVEPAGLRNLPVLVVDDNATNRRILREILTSWRMRPEDVPSGKDALALLRRRASKNARFSLALIDANMPEMDGFTLIERIRGNPSLKDLKIMVLTSADRRGDTARCRELGVQAYLTKPVRQSELLDAILLTQGAASTSGREKSFITRASASELRIPLRILLGEDNPINRKVAVRLLEKQGHTVRTASDGREVLSALEKERFDVVLMDVQMPEVDGFEATAIIREKEKGGPDHIPIVALTAHALKDDRKRCLDAGMDDYVSKPLKPEEFFRTIARVVKKNRKRLFERPGHGEGKQGET
jgi:PAS domain S-box-containing protein